MSNKLKAMVDGLAGGAYCWYMAGGGAAWWHISNHMETWHGAHEWDYFSSVEDLIFPGDIEGGALTGVSCEFASKKGMIEVSLAETPKEMFDDIVSHHCEQVDGIWVFRPGSVIRRYQTAGNKDKKEKRDIRVGMLNLVIKRQPITKQGVESHKPKGGGFLAAIGGISLKKADKK